MVNYLTGFECLKCGKQFAPDYGGYVCSACSENIDALYDYSSISGVFSVANLEKDKEKTIWRYDALYPFSDRKYIPNLDMAVTPLYEIPELEKETGFGTVFLKDDTRQPSGSFKDRAGAVVMAVAREKGLDMTTCASTGNAGCSWACMGAACGVKVIIYVPSTAPKAKIAQLKVYGADVRIVDSNYDGAYDMCVRDSNDNDYFNRCTGYNPFTREGKKSVAFEIWEQLGYKAPGTVFVPVGDGNIISGVWKGFRDLEALGMIEQFPRLIAVQSSNSDAVTKTVEKVRDAGYDKTSIQVETVKSMTRADSISVDRPRDGLAAVRAVIETKGECVRVSDSEIINAIYRIAAVSGIFAEPAGAASVAGLIKASSAGLVEDNGEPVVCLITGNGLKDVDAVLKGGDNE
ncbi:MAG: threonine synthase [Elusimicrobiota bacterium]